MRNVKMTALIGDSFNGMLEILFRPFSANKWARLILISVLAGMLFGGNFNYSQNNSESRKNTETVTAAQSKEAGKPVSKEQTAETAQNNVISRDMMAVASAVTVAAVVIMALLIIFMTWIGARFKFVWLNAVVNNTASVMEPFSRHRREGNSFFKLSLSLLVILVLVLAIIAGVTVYELVLHGAFKQGFDWLSGPAPKIIIIPALTAALFFIAFFIFAFLLEHFVVPIMAFDECAVSQALNKLGYIVRSNWKDMILFMLVFFGLSVVAEVITWLFGVLVVIGLLLAAALIFGLPFLLLWLILKAKIVFVVYAIIAFIPFSLFALTAILAASLPAAAFFRIFSVKYLLSLGAGYGPDSLERYSSKRAERIASRIPIVMGIIAMVVFTFIVLAGLLAAITIPNFIRARNFALEKKAAAAESVTVPVK